MPGLGVLTTAQTLTAMQAEPSITSSDLVVNVQLKFKNNTAFVPSALHNALTTQFTNVESSKGAVGHNSYQFVIS